MATIDDLIDAIRRGAKDEAVPLARKLKNEAFEAGRQAVFDEWPDNVAVLEDRGTHQVVAERVGPTLKIWGVYPTERRLLATFPYGAVTTKLSTL